MPAFKPELQSTYDSIRDMTELLWDRVRMANDPLGVIRSQLVRADRLKAPNTYR